MSVKNFFKKIDPQEDFDREDDYDAPYGDEAYNDRRRDDRRVDDRYDRRDDRRDGSRDDRRDGSRDDSRRNDRYDRYESYSRNDRSDRNDRYDEEDDYYAADTRSSRRDDSRDGSRDGSWDDRYDRRDDRRTYDDEDTGAYEEDRYANYRDYDYNSWRDRSAGRNDYADEPVEEEPEVKTPEIECFLPMAYAESRQGIVDCLRDGNIAVVDVSCLEVEPMTRLTDCLVGAALALELTLCRLEDSTIMVICPPEAELDMAALRAEMESFKADVLSDDDLSDDAGDASDADAADAE